MAQLTPNARSAPVRWVHAWWHDRSLFLDDQSPFLSPQEDHHRRHFRDRIRYSSYVSISDRRVRRLFRNQQEVESHDGVRLKKDRCGPHSPRMVSTICLYLSQVGHSVCGIDTFESVEEGKVPPRQVSFPPLFPIRNGPQPVPIKLFCAHSSSCGPYCTANY